MLVDCVVAAMVVGAVVGVVVTIVVVLVEAWVGVLVVVVAKSRKSAEVFRNIGAKRRMPEAIH